MSPQRTGMTKAKKRKIIGWREWIKLPELGLTNIKAKMDTGARTSALHATRIRYIRGSDGKTWVSFMVVASLNPHHAKRVRAPLIERRKVKSSMGHASIRPVIRTQIQIGDEVWETEITLVNRDPMGFRMLLGRRTLRERFVVHPGRSFILTNEGGPT